MSARFGFMVVRWKQNISRKVCFVCRVLLTKVLGIHETSTLHRSESVGVVERVVRPVKQGTAGVLSCTAVYQMNGDIEQRSVTVISSRCKTTCLTAKQHSEKRFSQKHDGPLVLLGACIKFPRPPLRKRPGLISCVHVETVRRAVHARAREHVSRSRTSRLKEYLCSRLLVGSVQGASVSSAYHDRHPADTATAACTATRSTAISTSTPARTRWSRS